MKSAFRCLSLLLVLGLSGPLQAALPQTLNYQGRLRTSGGAPVPDGNGNTLVFNIYNTGGTSLWSETWNSGTSHVTTTAGLFNVVLGSFNAITLPFDEQYYLGIAVNGDAEMTPRQPLTMAPYAFNAKNLSLPYNATAATGGSPVFEVANSASGGGLKGSSNGGSGVTGENSGASGVGVGGLNTAGGGIGVRGQGLTGVAGISNGTGGIGIVASQGSGDLSFKAIGPVDFTSAGTVDFTGAVVSGLPSVGESNTASNRGAGEGVFSLKSGVDLSFKSLKNTDGTMNFSSNSDEIDISAAFASAIWNADKLQGRNVSNGAPSTDDSLVYDGGQWAPGGANAKKIDGRNVTATTPSTDDALIYDGVQWQSGVVNTKKIDGRNVFTSGLTSGDALVYNGIQWENGEANAGSLKGRSLPVGVPSMGDSLVYGGSNWTYGLSNANKLQGVDVANTGPNNGDVLVYSSGSLRWEPGTASVTVPLSLTNNTGVSTLYAENPGATAIYGLGFYGVQGESTDSSASGVEGRHFNQGTGVTGRGQTGTAGVAINAGGIGLLGQQGTGDLALLAEGRSLLSGQTTVNAADPTPSSASLIANNSAGTGYAIRANNGPGHGVAVNAGKIGVSSTAGEIGVYGSGLTGVAATGNGNSGSIALSAVQNGGAYAIYSEGDARFTQGTVDFAGSTLTAMYVNGRLYAEGNSAGAVITGANSSGVGIRAENYSGGRAFEVDGGSFFGGGSVSFTSHVDFTGATVTNLGVPVPNPLGLSNTLATPVLTVSNLGSGEAISAGGTTAINAVGTAVGVSASVTSASGFAIQARGLGGSRALNAHSSANNAVLASTDSGTDAIRALNNSVSGSVSGVRGDASSSSQGIGVFGTTDGSVFTPYGGGGAGIYGFSNKGTADAVQGHHRAFGNAMAAVKGVNDGGSNVGYGVWGLNTAAGGAGVYAQNTGGGLGLLVDNGARFASGSVTFTSHVDFSGATITGWNMPVAVPLSLTNSGASTLSVFNNAGSAAYANGITGVTAVGSGTGLYANGPTGASKAIIAQLGGAPIVVNGTANGIGVYAVNQFSSGVGIYARAQGTGLSRALVAEGGTLGVSATAEGNGTAVMGWVGGTGSGVTGNNDAAGPGVRGLSFDGTGVQGISTNKTGVTGTGLTGTAGVASAAGAVGVLADAAGQSEALALRVMGPALFEAGSVTLNSHVDFSSATITGWNVPTIVNAPLNLTGSTGVSTLFVTNTTGVNAIHARNTGTFATILAANAGSGPGVSATSASGYGMYAAGGTGLYAEGSTYGVYGVSASSYGIYGQSSSGSPSIGGVNGVNYSTGPGVYGSSVGGHAVLGSSSANGNGVRGEANGTGAAVFGQQFGTAAGVRGQSNSGNGVEGVGPAGHGVDGTTYGYGFAGVRGTDSSASLTSTGVLGMSSLGAGVQGFGVTGTAGTANGVNGIGVLASDGGYTPAQALRVMGNGLFTLGSVTFNAHVDFSGATITGWNVPATIIAPLYLTSTAAYPGATISGLNNGTGHGLRGVATAAGYSATTYTAAIDSTITAGVFGYSNASLSAGVLGRNDANDQQTVGVLGIANLGSGVYGSASGLNAVGGSFEASYGTAVRAEGVTGVAARGQGSGSLALFAQASSPNQRALEASGLSSFTGQSVTSVVRVSQSSMTYGSNGLESFANASGAAAVKGKNYDTSSPGPGGISGVGVWGDGSVGVLGASQLTDGVGVVGSVNGGPGSAGVFAENQGSGTALAAESSGGVGIYSKGLTGISANTTQTGGVAVQASAINGGNVALQVIGDAIFMPSGGSSSISFSTHVDFTGATVTNLNYSGPVSQTSYTSASAGFLANLGGGGGGSALETYGNAYAPVIKVEQDGNTTALRVTTNGQGNGIDAFAGSASQTFAMKGSNDSANVASAGVLGVYRPGVTEIPTGVGGAGAGVMALNDDISGVGLYARAQGNGGTAIRAISLSGTAVDAMTSVYGGTAVNVISNSDNGYGVYATHYGANGQALWGRSTGYAGYGVHGTSEHASGTAGLFENSYGGYGLTVFGNESHNSGTVNFNGPVVFNNSVSGISGFVSDSGDNMTGQLTIDAPTDAAGISATSATNSGYGVFAVSQGSGGFGIRAAATGSGGWGGWIYGSGLGLLVEGSFRGLSVGAQSAGSFLNTEGAYVAATSTYGDTEVSGLRVEASHNGVGGINTLTGGKFFTYSVVNPATGLRSDVNAPSSTAVYASGNGTTGTITGVFSSAVGPSTIGLDINSVASGGQAKGVNAIVGGAAGQNAMGYFADVTGGNVNYGAVLRGTQMGISATASGTGVGGGFTGMTAVVAVGTTIGVSATASSATAGMGGYFRGLTGVVAQSTGASSVGVSVTAARGVQITSTLQAVSATTTSGAGVFDSASFQAVATGLGGLGRGVAGLARTTDSTGQAYGVFGQGTTAGVNQNGVGVFGSATGSGLGYGVYGQAQTTNGATGVLGEAQVTNGIGVLGRGGSVGVSATSASTAGVGLYAGLTGTASIGVDAYAATGIVAHGVNVGLSVTASDSIAWGIAVAMTGTSAIGVMVNVSSGGAAIIGDNRGNGNGVYGYSEGQGESGAPVRGWSTADYATNNFAVYGRMTGAGVDGAATYGSWESSAGAGTGDGVRGVVANGSGAGIHGQVNFVDSAMGAYAENARGTANIATGGAALRVKGRVRMEAHSGGIANTADGTAANASVTLTAATSNGRVSLTNGKTATSYAVMGLGGLIDTNSIVHVSFSGNVAATPVPPFSVQVGAGFFKVNWGANPNIPAGGTLNFWVVNLQ